MIDLLASALRLGSVDGREFVEIPSQLFVRKAEETLETTQVKAPL